MNQKLAIIIVLVLAAALGVGFWLYSRSGDQPAADSDRVVAPVAPHVQPAPAVPAPSVDETARRAELEAIINKAIPEKQAIIDKTAKGRRLTTDELDYFTNPRNNVIKELLKTGKISASDNTLLNK